MFKKIVTRLMAALLLIGSLATLSACNTIAGAGKDIEKGGAAIKDEANEKK